MPPQGPGGVDLSPLPAPFSPLNATGTGNDNLYYTGTAGTLYNPGAGLGIPNLTQLAADFQAAAH